MFAVLGRKYKQQNQQQLKSKYEKQVAVKTDRV